VYSLDGGNFQSGSLFIGVSSGYHTVMVADADGCFFNKIGEVESGGNVAVSESALEKFAVIFPNPTTGMVHISFVAKSTRALVSVYNAIGSRQLSNAHEVIPGNATTLSISLQNLAAGAYFIELEEGSRKQTMKVVKE
jgi:hypothetical protein